MLIVLAFLHIYWYGLFLRMGYVLVMTNKAEDIVNNIQATRNAPPRKEEIVQFQGNQRKKD
jgi:hypothetical protein